MRIVETDNDLPTGRGESFLNLPIMRLGHAEAVAEALNSGFGDFAPRRWKVVKDDYVLEGV